MTVCAKCKGSLEESHVKYKCRLYCSPCYHEELRNDEEKENKMKEQSDERCFTTTQTKIVSVCDSLKELLLEKNRAYGDSAISPVRIFSKASNTEQILVRIDDKLSRISRGSEMGEDVVNDLIGYLVLYKVANGWDGESL